MSTSPLPRTSRRSLDALLLGLPLLVACGETKKKEAETEEEEDDDKPKKKKKKKKDEEAKASAKPSATAAPTQQPTAKASEPAAPKKPAGPPALAAGQWVRYEKADPEKATTEYRIIQVDNDGTVTLEVDESAVGAKSTTELVLGLSDRTSTDAMVVKKCRVKTNTGVVTVPESGVRTSMIRMLRDLKLPALEGDKREDVTVRAGTFNGCLVREIEEDVLGAKLKATAYYHESVPINGFVKYEGKLDKAKATKELVAFGLTGAKAVF